jgi:hypothetical protein
LANKLIVYKVEDSETGKIYNVEGPEGATPEELGEFVLSQNLDQPVAAPASNDTISVPTAQPAPEREWADPVSGPAFEAQSGFDRLAQGSTPRPFSDDEAAQYLTLAKDPAVTTQQIGEFFTQTGRPFGSDQEIADFEKQRSQYLQTIQEGKPVSDTIGYRDRVQDVLGPYVQQEDPGAGYLGSALEEGMAYNPMGIVTRLFQDWTDAELQGGVGKESLRAQFPNLSDEAIESLHDDFIGEMRRRELLNAGAQVESNDVDFATRILGNIVGGSSPLDVVPLGRGATLPGRIAEGAVGNAAADALMQGQDVAYGAQGDYDFLQTAQAGLEGGALQGVLEGAIRGAGFIASTVSKQVDVPSTTATSSAAAGPIVVPVARKNSKAYKAQISETADGIVNTINTIAADWKNKPEFEVYQNFKDLDGVANDAIGVTTPDNKVQLNVENIIKEAKLAKVSPEDVVASITFHEALGHYGLSQKFGDGLEAVLNNFYNNSATTFKNKVDKWLVDNPKAYLNAPNRELRAAEEVLAEMSEAGRMPVTFVNAFSNVVKDFVRQLGWNLKFSEREIKTILGMSHSAVVNGKGRDVRGNGFRFMYAGQKAKNPPKTWLGAPDESRWFSGPDGLPRFEFSDAEAYLDEQRLEGVKTTYLPNVLDHKELFKQYPSLRDTRIRIKDLPEGALGQYNPATNLITVSTDNPFKLSTVLHEIQHNIQEIEGFAKGGAPDDSVIDVMPDDQVLSTSENYMSYLYPDVSKEAIQATVADTPIEELRDILKASDTIKFQAYESLLGEVEARDTQARQYMDDIDRKRIPPYTSQNEIAPPSSYIVNGNVDGNRYSKKLSKEVSEEDRILNAKTILSGALESYEPTYRSWAEGKRAARDRGLTAKQIKSAKSIGELDKRLFQYDAVAAATDEKLVALHEKMNDGSFTLRDKQKYLETVFSYNELSARIFDDQAEIARALNAMKALTYTKRKISELNDVLSEFQGNNLSAFADDEVFNRFAKQIQSLMAAGNPAGAHQTMLQILKPYWWQYVLSFRHSMMLSGLGTHVKNAYDNASMIARELEETAIAAPGFAIRKGLNKAGANVQEGVSPQEIGARMYALLRTALDTNTYKDTAKAFIEGHGNRQYSSKIEMQDARILGLSKVQDTLHATDTFFRAFHENANLYTLGVRKAREQGFTGMAAFEEGSNIAMTADPDMLDEARKMADVPLLVDKPSFIASKLEAAKAIRPNMTGGEQAGAAFANFMLPFFRVTDRLLFQKIRRMGPLALLDRVTREDLAAGGPRMDIALGRMALSSALIYYYWDQSEKENIKGSGPADFDKLAALQAGGYLPNSVKTEDKYIDATALNLSVLPDNLQNALAANIASIREAYDSEKESSENTAKALAVAVRSLLTELSSTSFAENISVYLEPFQEGPEYQKDAATANLAAGVAGQFVPAIARQYNQIVNDPYKRDTSGDKTFEDKVTGRLKSAIPGLSDDLPIKYDLYGDPMEQGRTWSGIDNYQNIKKDAVSKELQRLEKTSKEAVVKGAPSSFQYEGEQIKLNAEGKQEWQRVQGYYLKEGMKQVIPTEEWKQSSDADKIEIVKEIRTDAYEMTKEYMLPLLGLTTKEDE